MADLSFFKQMADLGNCGFTINSFKVNIVSPIFNYFTKSYGVSSTNVLTPLTGSISFSTMLPLIENIEVITKSIKGITRKDEIPTPKLVRLYDRQSGIMIHEVLSNLDGSFEFNGLSITKEFYVIVLDDGDSIYNALIEDHLFALC
jgi:hypothetical protein